MTRATRRRRSVSALGGLAAVAILVVAGFGSMAPAGATASAAGSAPAARRVLVVSLPMVTWADLPLAHLPHLRGLLAQSLIADLSVRGVRPRTTLGDGYVTISAGTRAVGSRTDGDAENRADGAVVARSFPEIVDHNSDLLYDAHPGALAEALRTAGIDRAVIGNADVGAPLALARRYRPVANALATPDGVVSGGDVSEGLMTANAAAPGGLRIEPDAYLAAFRRAWTGRTVVLVEDSDLVRIDASGAMTQRGRAVAIDEALRPFDRLLGDMLAAVDFSRDAVMVVGPTYPKGVSQLTVAALRAPGTQPGLAVSAFTRRSGFVSIVDIGPTILDTLRVEAPDSMEGEALEFGRTSGSFSDRLSFLVDSNDASMFRDSRVGPVTTAFLVSQLVLVLSAVIVFRWGNRALRRVVELIALSILGALPAMFLARLIPFDRHDLALYWCFLAGVGIAIGVGASLVGSRRGVAPLMVCLTIIVGVIAVDVIIGANLQLNSAFGYSPTIGGRYAGIGNLAYAQLSSAALLLAALIAFRVAGARGAWFATAVLALALLVDGLPVWGADIGGVLSMVPAYAIAATGFLGLRIRLRTVIIAGVATVVALVAATLVDLARPEEHQTHLGRLVRNTNDGGWHSLSLVIERKLSANLNALWVSQWSVMTPIVLAFLVYIVWQSPGGLRGLLARVPTLGPGLVGFAVLAVLGYALNDSGIPIPGVMIGVLAPVLIVILIRARDDDRVAA